MKILYSGVMQAKLFELKSDAPHACTCCGAPACECYLRLLCAGCPRPDEHCIEHCGKYEMEKPKKAKKKKLEPNSKPFDDSVKSNGNYADFLFKKTHLRNDGGFDPIFMPDSLFDFQAALCERQITRGRGALFAGTGLGKSLMELVFAENIVRHTNKPVLLLTPLAVSAQMISEGEKFGIECGRSKDGRLSNKKITVTNYQSLHKFNPNDVVACIGDESGCIKSNESETRQLVTDFMRKLPYRQLASATPSPNDYIELGTHSEALGNIGFMDMLSRFFKNDQNSLHPTSGRGRFERGSLTQNKWRFKAHAEKPFWRWVASWADVCRKPSDLGFSDEKYILPELVQTQTVVKASVLRDGFLLEMPAVGLKEQREELRLTIKERCEAAAEILSADDDFGVAWCHANPEGDLLERLIPNARQIKGSQSDDEKEELFDAFSSGQLKKLVIKPKIGAWGLNWQFCNRMTWFPSHSFEQFYQAVRRLLRFGQLRKVYLSVITTEGQRDVLENLQRKEMQAEKMFAALIESMNEAQRIELAEYHNRAVTIPAWL